MGPTVRVTRGVRVLISSEMRSLSPHLENQHLAIAA